MLRAVIFDVGGVLVRTVDWRGRRKWEARLGLQEMESEAIVFAGEMGTRAQLGQVTNEQHWAWIGRHLELTDAQLGDYRRDFWAGDRLDTGLADFIRTLRPAYQTAILSNATDSLRRKLNSRYPIADAFDLIVCSAEESVMKPDPEIYLRTLTRLGRRPEEAVFIDDSAENIATAANLGMEVVHFGPATDIAAELALLGISASGSLP